MHRSKFLGQWLLVLFIYLIGLFFRLFQLMEIESNFHATCMYTFNIWHASIKLLVIFTICLASIIDLTTLAPRSTHLGLVLEPASFGPTEQVVLSKNVSYCAIINLMFLNELLDAIPMVHMIIDYCNPLARVYWHAMLTPLLPIAENILAIVGYQMLIFASLALRLIDI